MRKMKIPILLLCVLVLSGCFSNKSAKLVEEYHTSVVDYYEGRRADIVSYSLDLEAALEDLSRSGRVRFREITIANVICSEENYAVIKKTAESFYREAIDITFDPDYGSPLVVRIYYYPEHENAIQKFISKLRDLG